MKIFGSILMAAALLAPPVLAENTPTLPLDLAAMPSMPVWNVNGGVKTGHSTV